MFRDPIARFKMVAFWEGVSYLVLLGIAMPLKHLAGMPLAVKIVGLLHGFLFIAYVVLLALAANYGKWSPGKVATGFVASLLPLGPMWFDRKLDQEAAAATEVEPGLVDETLSRR